MTPHEIDLFRSYSDNTRPWSVEINYTIGDRSISLFVHPATKAAPDAGDVCKTSESLQLCVWTDPAKPVPPSVAAIGGAKGLLARMTSLGMDEKDWTTAVVG
jgi:hypothetical protein